MAKYTFIGHLESDVTLLRVVVENDTGDVNAIVLKACKKLVEEDGRELEDIVVVDVVKGIAVSLIEGQHTSFVTDWGLEHNAQGRVSAKIIGRAESIADILKE